MELTEFRNLLDQVLAKDYDAIWQLLVCHTKGTLGLPPLAPVITEYIKTNFHITEEDPSKGEWINVDDDSMLAFDGTVNKNNHLFDGKVFIVECDYTNDIGKYNEHPLSVVPYYRLKEAVDQDWTTAQGYAERRAKKEAERIAKEETERKAREEAERIAKEEAERKAKEEAERIAKEEAERKAREEAERIAKEEAERKAKEEAERKAKEEAERKAKEEAERKVKEEAERKAKEEAERKAKEEAERKAKEEAERKAEEEAERSSYKSLIEEFVSDTKECEYKDGIIFGKKKTIRYVAAPITKHIWNAVVNKSAESDFDDDEYVPQKELGDFIKELNAHFEGRVVFEYLHKNIHANVHLQVYEKLDKNACFVYIKEDNR